MTYLALVINPNNQSLSLILNFKPLFVTILLCCTLFFRSALEEGLYCKPKYRANLFKYILHVLAILFFFTSAVRISLPSVFCILDILLIQVYKRSGTTHRFVAVVLQMFIVFVTQLNT